MDFLSDPLQCYPSSCLSLVNVGLCDWRHVDHGALGRARGLCPTGLSFPAAAGCDGMALGGSQVPPWKGLAEMF